jgi:tol-pal system protein YbgF
MKIVTVSNTAAVLVLAGLLIGPTPSRAAAAAADNKAQTRIEVEVQELTDALARLQQTSDERWALTKSSLDANADTMNKIATSLTAIQQQLAAAQDSGRADQLTSQVQAVHDSIDEVKARLGRLEKQLNDMAAAQQNLQSQPVAQPAPGAAAMDNGRSAAQQTAPAAAVADAGPAAYVPPAKDLYQSAYRDYTGGHYTLASQEFAQIVQTYPQDDLAANAQFYVGEIAFHQGQYRDAAKAYDAVLQNYPGSPKTAAAQLQKGDSLIQIGQRAEGIRELRAVVQHYPQSPESVQARSTLNGMGVTPTPKPSPVRNQ